MLSGLWPGFVGLFGQLAVFGYEGLRPRLFGKLGGLRCRRLGELQDKARAINRRILEAERTNTYVLIPDGIKFGVFYTKLHNRLLRPLMAAHQVQAPPELRQALDVISLHVDDYISGARIGKAA
jgi:hypothetical protein